MTNKGSGYTSTPTITIDDPGGPSGETCTAYATVENETVDSITIISSGSQYTETPDVTISGEVVLMLQQLQVCHQSIIK